MKTCIITIIILSFIGLITQSVLSQSVDIETGLVAYWNFNETTGKIAKDTTGNGHHGTLRGDSPPKWTSDGYFNGALEFDANGEVVVPYHEDLNPSELTICAWARREQVNYQQAMVVFSGDVSETDAGYGMSWNSHLDGWVLRSGEGGLWIIIYDHAEKPDDWNHIAGVITSEGAMRLYINGKRMGKEQTTFMVPNYEQPLLIGAGKNSDGNNAFYFKGTIDEVRLYNRALEADEIAQVMATQTLAVETSGKLTITWGQLKKK